MTEKQLVQKRQSLVLDLQLIDSQLKKEKKLLKKAKLKSQKKKLLAQLDVVNKELAKLKKVFTVVRQGLQQSTTPTIPTRSVQVAPTLVLTKPVPQPMPLTVPKLSPPIFVPSEIKPSFETAPTTDEVLEISTDTISVDSDSSDSDSSFDLMQFVSDNKVALAIGGAIGAWFLFGRKLKSNPRKNPRRKMKLRKNKKSHRNKRRSGYHRS